MIEKLSTKDMPLESNMQDVILIFMIQMINILARIKLTKKISISHLRSTDLMPSLSQLSYKNFMKKYIERHLPRRYRADQV